MSSQVAANQSYSGKRTSANLAKAMKWARAAIAWVVQAAAAVANYSASFANSGSTVAAGAQIVTLATVAVSGAGIFRVTMWFSGTAPAGNVTPIFGAALHGTSIPVLVSFEQDTTTHPNASAVFYWNSGLTVGQLADFSFTTTAGDQVVTLGHGVTGKAAGLIIEELPGTAV